MLYANSSAIVALAYSAGSGPTIRTQEAGQYDVWHPIYFALASDPLVNTKCTLYCNGISTPATIHIPAKARAAQGSDHHLGVVQPDGTEIDFWLVSDIGRDWKTGDTVTYGGGGNCNNFLSGPGIGSNEATLGGACLASGIVRATEMQAQAINHALFLVTGCLDPGANSYVYPATQAGQHCTGPGPNPYDGMRVQLDLTDAQINALSVTAWEKTILHALHDYGGYLMDTGGGDMPHTDGLVGVMFESPEPYAAYGNAVPLDAWAQSVGWQAITIAGAGTRYIGADPWTPLNWAQHLRIVDPCYAMGTCH
ncbi:MAG TPA: hypothetical protein VGZ00_10870 [Candidatus Baltobacteraceae bacterium]|nr:hypothetical protein [Candidatus Baltobacteraceae bacterium]